MEKLIVDGPVKFSELTRPSKTNKDLLDNKGIYLWTVKIADGFLIYYIGETGSLFSNRLKRHRYQLKRGDYRLYDPQHFSKGKKKLIWNPYKNGAGHKVNHLDEYNKIKQKINKQQESYNCARSIEY